MSTLDFANSRVFGNAAFRPQQREVVQAVMQARAFFVHICSGSDVKCVGEPHP